MIVTWFGHAQLFLNAANRSLLLDPWFAEPVFGGAWFRYPPPPYPNASMVQRPDFLLLSHIHPDHSGPGTLDQLPRNLATYAMPFPSNALKRRLTRAGFTNVHWVDPWQTIELSHDLKLTFVPHDRGWEVSSMVIEADGVRLYHGNDNTLSIEAYEQIVNRLGDIDLAFLPFAGASSYPTGFDGDRATLEKRCAQKKAEGLKRFTDGIVGLKPKEAAPFASSWALLEPSELWKNFLDRPTPDEALKAAMPIAAEHDTHLLHLEPGDEWSPETGVVAKHLTEGWSYDAKSVERYAKQEEARVAAALAKVRVPSHPVPPATLDAAMRDYFAVMLEKTAAATRGLKMIAGIEAKGGAGWRLAFEPGQAPVFASGLTGDEDEVLTLPAGELWGLLTTSANWEDVWYGYRLQVHKREGASYYRAFWEMLLNFDAEALSESLAKKYAA